MVDKGIVVKPVMEGAAHCGRNTDSKIVCLIVMTQKGEEEGTRFQYPRKSTPCPQYTHLPLRPDLNHSSISNSSRGQGFTLGGCSRFKLQHPPLL